MNDFRKMALFNTACYSIGWLLIIIFGIKGYSLLVVTAVTALITLQLAYTRKLSPTLFVQDLILLPFATFSGIILEMIFIQIGVVDYTRGLSIFPPLWIIVFYPLFSLLINHSLTDMTKSFAITFCSGLFVAPISYMAGGILGGLKFNYPIPLTWLILGTFWGLFLCFMRYISNEIEKAAKKTFQESKNAKELKFFYDGNCPICSKEVCHLQKKDAHASMKFINIASTEEFNNERGNLTYDTAMTKMHAMDDHGNVLVGLDAFAASYARCNMPVVATILNIPFFRPLLDPLYTLFAKHRTKLQR